MPNNLHSTWTMAKVLHEIKPRANPDDANPADQQFMCVRAAIAHELNLVGKTLCVICGGHGHNRKACPTNKKLKHFSKAGISQSIIKRCKDTCKQNGSRINRGEEAPWSLLPAA